MRPRGRGARARRARSSAWSGVYVAVTGGARPGLLRRLAGLLASALRFDALVRDRQQPPRGTRPPRDRVRPGRAGDEDPRQVPALARGGAASSCCRPRRTSRASSARTPTTSASTASSTSTSSTRASSSTSASCRPRRSSARPQRRNRRFETSARARSCSTAIAVVTVVVISAWKSSGGEHADEAARKKPHREDAGVERRPRTSCVKGVGGSSFVAIRRERRRPAGRLPGHGREGRDAAVQGQALLAQRQLARAPRDHGRRQARRRSRGERPRVITVTPTGLAGGLSRRPRGAILVTGSELVRGDRTDRNGPFLAQSLVSLGIEPVEVRIVGDAADELERALARRARARPARRSRAASARRTTTARSSCSRAPPGAPLVLDEALRAADRDVDARRSRSGSAGRTRSSRRASASRRRCPRARSSSASRARRRRSCCEPDGCVAVTLPGPPRELQAAVAARARDGAAAAAARARASRRTRRVAAALRRVRVGRRARRSPRRAATGTGWRRRSARATSRSTSTSSSSRARRRARTTLEAALAAPLERVRLRARRAAPIEEIVLALCRERGLTLATAESCTGGLVAARLTSVPGSSDVFVGGVVSYANEVKASALGVPAEVLREHGAVSAETAAAMARGRARAARGRRGRGRDGHRGPGRRDARRSRSGSSTCMPPGPDGERAVEFIVARRPRDGAQRARPSPRCTSCANLSQSCDRHVTGSAASVGGGESLRLFCALRLPDEASTTLVRWQQRELRGRRAAPGERIVPPTNLHLTLAFLGARPAGEAPAIGAALRTAAAEAGELGSRVRGYRETRSVGMLVFDDEGKRARQLAERLHGAARGARASTARAAAVAAAPHRAPVPRAAGARPAAARSSASSRSVRCGCLHLRLRPGGAEYEVLGIDRTRAGTSSRR